MRFYRKNRKFYLLCLLLAAVGIVAGILFAAKGGLSRIKKTGVFSNYYLHEYAYLTIDRAALFWIVAKERGKWFFLLWAAGMTGAGIWLSGFFPVLWGFFASVFFAQALLKQGLSGLALALLFQMPQALIYLPLFLWSLYQAAKKSAQIRTQKKTGAVQVEHRTYMRCFVTAFGILLLGILTESYGNSFLVQLILRIFY